MRSRVGVVTEISDPGRTEPLSHAGQQAVPDLPRHPRIKAVGDNLVEASRSEIVIQKVGTMQRDVLQSQRGDGAMPARDLPGG